VDILTMKNETLNAGLEFLLLRRKSGRMELAHLPTNIALNLPGTVRKLDRTQQCCLLSLVKARASIISQLSPKNSANWAEGPCS
jgi:hypothetical protein